LRQTSPHPTGKNSKNCNDRCLHLNSISATGSDCYSVRCLDETARMFLYQFPCFSLGMALMTDCPPEESRPPSVLRRCTGRIPQCSFSFLSKTECTTRPAIVITRARPPGSSRRTYLNADKQPSSRVVRVRPYAYLDKTIFPDIFLGAIGALFSFATDPVHYVNKTVVIDTVATVA
jgi:hypothetical protein